MSSRGRGRLPVWVTRMRSVLCSMGSSGGGVFRWVIRARAGLKPAPTSARSLWLFLVGLRDGWLFALRSYVSPVPLGVSCRPPGRLAVRIAILHQPGPFRCFLSASGTAGCSHCDPTSARSHSVFLVDLRDGWLFALRSYVSPVPFGVSCRPPGRLAVRIAILHQPGPIRCFLSTSGTAGCSHCDPTSARSHSVFLVGRSAR